MSSKIVLQDNSSTPRDFTGEDAKNLGGGVAAKAWVYFNGETFGVNKSYNVDAVNDLGVGTYQVVFTNAMADTNYLTIGNHHHTDVLAENGHNMGFTNKTTSAVELRTGGDARDSYNLYDYGHVFFMAVE